MSNELRSKYGEALTGSDWPGLPLRIGHVPESGHVEDLYSDVDSVLVWAGGPSNVSIRYLDPPTGADTTHAFLRTSGMVDLLPRTVRLRHIEWEGKESLCIGVNLPSPCLEALSENLPAGLDPTRPPRFGLLDAHLVDLVYRLQKQAEGQEYWGAVYVQSLSLALAAYVSARYGPGSDATSEPRNMRLSTTQRRTVEDFVRSRLADNFGLVDLARLVGYSPDHFSKLFKNTFEQSPHQYVLSRRIEKAKALLNDPQLSIAEVALSCGFSNQGHLTTAFKQRTGLTPGKFRKN